MDKQQILTAAIDKAIAGGWDCPSLIYGLYHNTHYEIKGQSVEMIRGFITSHDFAKALWGDSPVYNNFKHWQWHLTKMVVADDPIKYLGENI